MSFVEISAHPAVLHLVKVQSGSLVGAFRSNPRLSSVFATQQRWLMAHAAIALAFSDPGNGVPQLTLSRFLAEVERYGIASRNTADAFLKEMLHYGYAERVNDPTDRRAKPVRIAPEPMALLRHWAEIHLVTLDQMDGGTRLVTLNAIPQSFIMLEREIAVSVLSTPVIPGPKSTFSLFTWLNNGGAIMDWLIAGLGDASTDGTRYATSVIAVNDIADWIKLSRTHLTRKLREAEALGSMGWSGARGASPMWVSSGFVGEVISYQSAKLAIIDAACQRAFKR